MSLMVSQSAPTPGSSPGQVHAEPGPATGEGSAPAGDDPLRPPPLRIDLTIETDEPDPPLTGWLDVQLAKLAALAGVAGGELSLAVVDDAQMAALHEQYRGEAGTTDVLSFDLRDEPGVAREVAKVQGEVIVCLDEARRQAAARGHAVRLELLLYALHGLLHLVGEDDKAPEAAARMHRREDELLTRAGLGAVYGKD